MLGACVSVPQLQPPPLDVQAAWQTHRNMISTLSLWKTQARVALRTPEQAGTASLIWVRTPVRQTMDLVGPFGAGRVHIVQNASGATLTRGSRSYHASDATALLFEVTGWHLPLDGFDHWARGLPMAGSATLQFDVSGRLESLVQAGWTVQYADYQKVDNVELPTRMVMTRALEKAGDVLEVRLVIQQWVLGPDSS